MGVILGFIAGFPDDFWWWFLMMISVDLDWLPCFLFFFGGVWGGWIFGMNFLGVGWDWDVRGDLDGFLGASSGFISPKYGDPWGLYHWYLDEVWGCIMIYYEPSQASRFMTEWRFHRFPLGNDRKKWWANSASDCITGGPDLWCSLTHRSVKAWQRRQK